MDHICMTIPVVAGKTAAARAFMRELDGARRAEYDASERRIGITKEVWFLSASPAGDQLVGYMEAADFQRALTAFVGSRDPFDMWFKEQMQAVTGVDLNNPPADMAPAEVLSAYVAGAAASA